MAVFRRDRFRVELHAVDRSLDMTQTHDLAVAGVGGGAQAGGQGFRVAVKGLGRPANRPVASWTIALVLPCMICLAAITSPPKAWPIA